MDVCLRQPFDAVDCLEESCANGPQKTRFIYREFGRKICILISAAFLSLFAIYGAFAQDIRIGIWHSGLSRKGPGLLLLDLIKASDPQSSKAIDIIYELQADILLLTAFDYDYRGLAASALQQRLKDKGLYYPEVFALRPNSGMASFLDLNGNGRLGEAADAQGWGRFSGQAGLLILSKYPILSKDVRDFTAFLWHDLPGHLMPETSVEVAGLQRLSSTNHYELPILLPNHQHLKLLVWSATPPAFEGKDGLNGRRNHDEAAFWQALLAQKLPYASPEFPYVLIGDAKLDPDDPKQGRAGAITALLNHPLLQDLKPRHPSPWLGGPKHRGDPALDTAIYQGLGGLRSDYILPSRDLDVTAAGVWPGTAGDPIDISKHYPVFLDLTLKCCD